MIFLEAMESEDGEFGALGRGSAGGRVGESGFCGDSGKM